MLLKKLIGSLGIGFLGESILCCLFASSPARAQIVPDNTLPQNSIVTPQGNIVQIDGGTRAGNNLFHSFEQFSVGMDETAHFNNAMDIQNILSRVTGGSISEINGILKANGVANLFLINPNGIIFGENAALDIGGSFFATSADSVVFGNDAEFRATNPNTPPLLTINIPVGLWFRENPGSIVNRSRATMTEINDMGEPVEVGLQIQSGQTLALLGGDVSLEGGILTTPRDGIGGRVELGSVAGNSLVSLIPVPEGFALGYDGVQNFQDISLSDLAEVNTSGEQGGAIQIQGKQVTLTGDTRVLSSTSGAETGRDIVLKASEVVEMSGGEASTLLATETTGIGNAGNLTIATQKLIVRDGAFITTQADSSALAQPGNLTIVASDSVQLRRTNSRTGISTRVDGEATGAGRSLTINTERLLIQNGAQVFANTFGTGQGTDLNISAAEVELEGAFVDIDSDITSESSGLFTEVREGATGNSGALVINTDRLVVRDGAQISTDTFGAGNAGNLIVQASSVELIGTIPETNDPSAVFANVADATAATGNGGNLMINTDQLIVRDGAQIGTTAQNQGQGGTATINATNSVLLSGTASIIEREEGRSGIFVSAEPPLRDKSGDLIFDESGQPFITTADAGQLIINTPELIIEDGARISADNFGTGGGSNVNLNVGRLTIRDGGQIGAGSLIGEEGLGNERGPGGTITINASEAVEITGTTTIGANIENSRLFTSAEGTGDAGSLSIFTPNLTVTDGGEVNVGASGTGNAGSLTVDANLIRLENGTLSADNFGTGIGGSVDLNVERLIVRDGGQVGAGSLVREDGLGNERGPGGTLTVNASEVVEITGKTTIGANIENSRLFTSAEGTGDAGNLSIFTPNLTVSDGGEVNVSATGTGEAGSLTVEADSIRLEDGSLSAETRVGNQGNITLEAEEIRLRRESQITTNSLETGTGGNIEIDTDVLVAIENSDISANALAGPGGQVIINADAIFGTQFRQQQTNASDITATSELGAEFSGTVELNTQFDPSSAVIELPVTVVDPAALIAQEFCRQRGGSEFVNTGRGGLPPSPQESLRSEQTLVNLIELPEIESPSSNAPVRRNSTAAKTPNQPISSLDIVPARGWIRDENGDVILVSYDPTKTGVQRQRHSSTQCQP